MATWYDFDDSVIMPSPEVVDRLNRGIERERISSAPVTIAPQYCPTYSITPSNQIPIRPLAELPKNSRSKSYKKKNSYSSKDSRTQQLPAKENFPVQPTSISVPFANDGFEGWSQRPLKDIPNDGFEGYPQQSTIPFPNDGFEGMPLAYSLSYPRVVTGKIQYRSPDLRDKLELAYVSPQEVRGKINTTPSNINYDSIVNAEKFSTPYDIRNIKVSQPRYAFAKNGKVIYPPEAPMAMPIPLTTSVPIDNMPIPIEELQPNNWFGNVYPERYDYGMNLEGAFPIIRRGK